MFLIQQSNPCNLRSTSAKPAWALDSSPIDPTHSGLAAGARRLPALRWSRFFTSQAFPNTLPTTALTAQPGALSDCKTRLGDMATKYTHSDIVHELATKRKKKKRKKKSYKPEPTPPRNQTRNPLPPYLLLLDLAFRLTLHSSHHHDPFGIVCSPTQPKWNCHATPKTSSAPSRPEPVGT